MRDTKDDKLRLGKGATFFVKSQLKRLPQEDETWEADFRALPKPITQSATHYLGLVLVPPHGDHLAMWGQQGFHFNADFQEAIADFYDGALHVVNFQAEPEKAVKTINAWVSDRTRARIKELIDRDVLNDDTRLILTNAIYFKGQWESVFEKIATGRRRLARPQDQQGADDAPEGWLPVLRG